MKYSVYGIITGTKFLGEFEAVSGDEAIKIALESDGNSVTVCHQCAKEFSLDEHSCCDAFAEEA